MLTTASATNYYLEISRAESGWTYTKQQQNRAGYKCVFSSRWAVDLKPPFYRLEKIPPFSFLYQAKTSLHTCLLARNTAYTSFSFSYLLLTCIATAAVESTPFSLPFNTYERTFRQAGLLATAVSFLTVFCRCICQPSRSIFLLSPLQLRQRLSRLFEAAVQVWSSLNERTANAKKGRTFILYAYVYR